MKKKITRNIRFFRAVRSMDKRKVFRKLKGRRQQRKKNRMVNSIQQQSNNLNCQIESLASRMEQFQVKAR